MREITSKKVKVVIATTAGDFEIRLNEALDEIARTSYKYEIQYNMNAGFCAYITYESSLKLAETLKDKAELSGKDFTCADCKHLVESKDKRKAWHVCKFAEFGCTRKTTPACELFYEELEKELKHEQHSA